MAIKLLDNSARFKVFSQHDPSVDDSEQGAAAYVKYTESLNPADLKFKDGAEPATAFLIRCLTSTELGEIQEKHVAYSPVDKKTIFRHGFTAYLLECFSKACLGVEKADGSLQKIALDDIGLPHATCIGGLIASATTTGKNLKNA